MGDGFNPSRILDINIGLFYRHQCNLDRLIGLILRSRSNVLPQISIVYFAPRGIFSIILFKLFIQFFGRSLRS
jgi:hypothetical protein